MSVIKFQSKPAKEMVGVKLAGCEVLSRAPTVSRAARWRVRADACGHVFPVEGGYLRVLAKAERIVRCPTCNPRKESL